MFISFEAAAATPEEQARFIAAARKAFAAHDASGLAALTCWDRVPERLKQSGQDQYARDVSKDATEINLTDPDPNFPDLDWTDDGVTYHSNLTVTKQLKIRLASGTRIETGGKSVKVSDAVYPVGEKDGKLFLLEPAPVK